MDNAVVSHAVSSWPWYLVRACGLASAALLVLMIISGIGMITGYTFKYWPPIKAWLIHRMIGLSFLVALAGHIFFLLLDTYKHYSIAQILIPFATDSIWLSFGIIGFYFILIIIATSLTIMKNNRSTWKLFHYLAYLTIALVFFHALNLGTDLASGWLRALWIIAGIVILYQTIKRISHSEKI